MVDPRKARHLLSLFRRYRSYLDELASRGDEVLLDDFALMGAVQHYLLLAVETVLDLGSHVISSEGYEPPGSYADVFRVLRDEELLDEDLADRLMAMARFRNVLVHAYADVDAERVLRILHESVSDLDRFIEVLSERFRRDLGD